MKKTLGGLAALLAVTFALTGTASAQYCGDGYSFCAQVQIGAPPPPVVYFPPAPPPVVWVQPAPPPPPIVYQVTPLPPAPPPVVIVRPRPRLVYYSEPVQVAAPVFVMPERQVGLGLHLGAAAVSENEDPMAGFGAHIRYRTNPRFAVEGTLDLFRGVGYEGIPRREIPLTLNGLWYLNPQSRFQFYFLAGLGVASAHIGSPDYSSGEEVDTTFAGVQAGLGAELRLGRHFAVSGDIRGFVRGRLDESFHSEEAACRDGECTPYEGGATFNAAATMYF
ncbi:MAG: porin family protein [Deltaproteobacteria bacterium]|nr:porin family protein [Deltaproteobacteria bacterium]